MTTEAPTSDATTNQLEKEQKVLNENEIEFVSVSAQDYFLRGRFFDEGEAVGEYEYTPEEYEKYLKNPLVVAALKERGVLTKELPPVGKEVAVQLTAGLERRAKLLTAQQLIVANTLLDTVDTRSEKKKLQDLRVSTATYQAWCADPVFRDYVVSRAEKLLGQAQADAHLALIDQVKGGNLNAIKYYNEIVGRFTQDHGGVNVNVGTNASKQDFKRLIFHILEIIQDEVDDPAAKIRIGERFKDLISKATVADMLAGDDDEIVVPQVAKARVLTPELQNLLDKGEGYE